MVGWRSFLVLHSVALLDLGLCVDAHCEVFSEYLIWTYGIHAMYVLCVLLSTLRLST